MTGSAGAPAGDGPRGGPDALVDHLTRHRAQLFAIVRREAGVLLLRFEADDDLVQGVHAEVLRSAGAFEWRGEGEFVAWLRLVARRYLAGRRDHWLAAKRRSSALLRLTWNDGGVGGAGEAAGTATGPATFADRREQLVLVARAAALLPPRDREIVRWTGEGVPLAEQAARLGISYDAAERARARAVARLRRLFALVRS